MIKFKISLLLAFNLNRKVDEVNKSKKRPKSKKGKKSKSSDQSSKKSKKSKDTKKKEKRKKSGRKEAMPEEEIKDYEFKVGKPLGYIHIDYNLMPGFKYKLDVVCWGPIAKIYTVDGVACYKTIIKDGNAWIPVFLEHSRNPLQIQDIVKYKDYVINFHLDANKKKVAAKAKNDKTKMFYIKEENIESENFVEAYDVNPNLQDIDLKKDRLEYCRNLMLKFVNSPDNVKIDTWVQSQCKPHASNMVHVIKRIESGGRIDCREYVPPPDGKKTKTEKGEKKKKKKKNKSESSKEKRVKIPTSMNIKIPAKLLYTDPTLLTYRLHSTMPAINHAFFMLSSEHLMSVPQKLELAPFVMKVLKISNFPCDQLKQNGFDNIYVSCEVPNLISFKTNIQPVASETIKVLDSHIVFTKDQPKQKMLEHLQTQKVKLEIYGVKNELLEAEKLAVFTPRSTLNSKPSMSGTESRSSKSLKSSKSKSKKSTLKGSKKSSGKSSKKSNQSNREEKKDTLLALATFDVSSLLNNVWMFKEKGQCHNPNILMAQKGTEIVKFIDRYTIQEANMIIKETIPSPLEEELLLRLGTTIKLETFFLAPQYPSSSIINAPVTFKRLLVIMFDVEPAKSLLHRLFVHNQDLTGMTSFFPNPLLTFDEGQNANHSSSIGSDGQKDVITGFSVDSDMGNFIIYLEGLSNGFILSLFHQVHHLNPSKTKVFYDSDYLFEDRIYPRCTQLIYSVALKIPLEDMLKKPEIYIEGNVPLAAWKAVLKLHLICTSLSFKSILQNHLLPTEQEICCLNDEFAVGTRYLGDLTLEERRNTQILRAEQQTELQLLTDFA